MTNHLSDQQLSEWVLGEAGSDAIRHLEACASCRREAERLRSELGAFRESIHAHAGSYSRPWVAPPQAERPHRLGVFTHRWAYAMALATVIVASVVLLRLNHGRMHQPPAGYAAENEILMQIQTDVSETVPGALEPGELLVAGVAEPQPAVAEGSEAPKTSRR